MYLQSDLTPSSPLVLDLVLLACNWGTMGDNFFVWHHLAAIYAYTYVLVSLINLRKNKNKLFHFILLFSYFRHVVCFPTLPIFALFPNCLHHS